MNKELDHFYQSKKEPHKSCLLTLRDIILDFDNNLGHTMKYGMPCFVYKNKHFCYLWIDKKTNEPYILVVEGDQIDHPNLIKGDRKRMKILPIDSNKDIPLQTIHEIFNLALKFYT